MAGRHKKFSDKKVINAWCMFDWANSAYSLVISTAIFPVYYINVTTTETMGDMVNFFGLKIANTVLLDYSIAFSFIIIAFFSPLLSGIADFTGRKKLFMQIFTYLGGLSCCMLFFFTGKTVEWGIMFSVLASIGFSGALVFYNAFLPEITTYDKFDQVSAKGFSMGYIGSLLLLGINLAMTQMPEFFGLRDAGIASRTSFLMVGLWWMGFAQIPFAVLPQGTPKQKAHSLFKQGYNELAKAWQQMQGIKPIKRFLPAFFFWSMGVQTIILLASTFGSKVLGMSTGQLISVIIIIQVIAAAGAHFFAWVSGKIGNKAGLLVMISIWFFICFGAYFIQTSIQFYVLALFVGLVMGGIQSLSRATYSKLLPENTDDHASFFSFYDVMEKLATSLGTFLFGFIEFYTGNMRNSALMLAALFLLGFIFMSQVKVGKKFSR